MVGHRTFLSDHTMDCMRHETFGPTLPIMKVDGEEEAVRLANDSPYGLSASVFTGDARRAERVAGPLEAGAANINNVLTNFLQLPLPMGGWNESGLGTRLGGANAILKFCRPQVHAPSQRPRLAPPGYGHRAPSLCPPQGLNEARNPYYHLAGKMAP